MPRLARWGRKPSSGVSSDLHLFLGRPRNTGALARSEQQLEREQVS
jgi:hypothetical protein